MYEAHDQTANGQAKLTELIKDIKFAMFTTHKPNGGHLHSRPMTTQNKRIDDDSLWFHTVSSEVSAAAVSWDLSLPG